MYKLENNPTRKSVVFHIASSSNYGNLCLFIGAGFSKELVGDEALSWGSLLIKTSKELKINFDFDSRKLIGVGYPEIASLLCREYMKADGLSFEESMKAIKEKVSELTCWHPIEDKRIIYAENISFLTPAWIVTTNYDLVIESLFPGTSISIRPDESLVFPRGRIPVYHLHGVRTYPQSLVLCREDYTALFRPNEYRQLKLALTLKESTTLLLGYGLGDDNVLTAYDWSRNVFKHDKGDYPNGVIQIVRSDNPVVEPYRASNGVLILEVLGVKEFFDELMPDVRELKIAYAAISEKMESIKSVFLKTPEVMANKFIDDKCYRLETLKLIMDGFLTRVIDGFVPFFDKVIDETFSRSQGYGKFLGYAQGLEVVLDILCAYGEIFMPPALFQKVANALKRQAQFIGPKPGQSHRAGEIWKARKAEIPPLQLKELRIYSQNKSWLEVVELLK